MRHNSHILLYTDDADTGGVAQYNHALLCHLAEKGYRASCAQKFSHGPLVAAQAQLGIGHHWLPFELIADSRRSFGDIDYPTNVFWRLEPDLILFSNSCPVSNFAGKEAAVRLGLPFVVVESFADEPLAKRFAGMVRRLAEHYAQARAVVTVSTHTLHLLRQAFGLPLSAGQVIYYGRPALYFERPKPALRAHLRGELGIGEEDVVCLTTARLEEVKGHWFLLAGLKHLRQSLLWQRLRFVWLGGGSLEEQLATTVEREGLTGQIYLLGHRWDAADWLSAADIFVLTSLAEGMPLSVMEAMAKGLPVLATAVSGVPEELGPTGRLLPDPTRHAPAFGRELVATISAWAADANLRREIGAACREQALVRFREERMLQETQDVLEMALAGQCVYLSRVQCNQLTL
jgi:glycosyltransferase involved in cell wall biosynthesis